MSKYSDRPRDIAFMMWCKTLPCAVPGCNTGLPIQFAHIKLQMGSASRKAPDWSGLPLCGRGFSRVTGKFSNEDHHWLGKQSEHVLKQRFGQVHGFDVAEQIYELNRVWAALIQEKPVDHEVLQG